LRAQPDWLVFDEPNGVLGLQITAVPLPGGLLLFVSGIAILGWLRRR
jgi:hypothetical protein